MTSIESCPLLPELEFELGMPAASAPPAWDEEPVAPAVLLLAELELADPDEDDGRDGMGLGLPLLDEGEGNAGDDWDELLDDDGVDGMLLEDELDDDGMDGMLLLLLDWLMGDWQAARPTPRPIASKSLDNRECLMCIC